MAEIIIDADESDAEMTREEAWNRIDAIIEKHEVDDVYVTITNYKDYDALRLARKLLEQEHYEDTELINIRQELLDRGDEMVSFRQLVERFEKIEEVYKGIPWTLKQIYANFNILIGEKLCEDCISRKEVLDGIINSDLTGWQESQALQVIEDLPSVQPKQQRAGKWEKVTTENRDGFTLWWYACSECGAPCSKTDYGTDYFSDYCPCCGTKLEEMESKNETDD